MVKKSEVPEIEEERKEPENSHFYPFVIFYGESIEVFRRALRFYFEFLNKEIKEIEEDNAFSFLVSEENEGLVRL